MEEQDPQPERRPRPRRKARPKTPPPVPTADDRETPEEPLGSASRSTRTPQTLPEVGAEAWDPEGGTGGRPESRTLDRREGPGKRSADFERIASENPRTAVLGALVAGLAVGFLLGRLLGED